MHRTLLIAFALAVASSPAAAQSSEESAAEPVEDQTERARQLFGEGVAHASEGRFADAAQSFRAALELRVAPAIQYNLARALVELDQLVDAYQLASAAAAHPDAPEGIRRDAEVLRDQVRPQLALLSVSLGGEADGVRLDGRDLTPEEIDVPIPLLPGAHEVVGLRLGEEVSRRSLTLRAGVETVLDVSVVQSPREAAEQTPLDPDPEPRDSRTGLILGVVGGAVAAIVIVVIIAVVAGGGTQSPVRGNFEPGVIRW